MIKFAVFQFDNNRFVFPSIYDDGEDKTIDYMQCMMLEVSLGIKREKENLEVPIIDGELRFAHVKGEILHPSFMHGAATVYYISGPEFDSVKEKHDDNQN